jgi:hypothetical protein
VDLSAPLRGTKNMLAWKYNAVRVIDTWARTKLEVRLYSNSSSSVALA